MLGYAPQRQILPLIEFLDVGVGGAALLLKKGDRRHDLARGAVPTLVAIVFDKGRLHRMQVAGLAKPLDRGDLVALVHDGQRQAGVDAAAVHVDGAGSALAMVAALLSAGQADGLAQAVEERRAGVNVKIELFAVNLEADRDGSFDRFSGRCSRSGHESHGGCRLRRGYDGTGRRNDTGCAERGKEGAAAHAAGRTILPPVALSLFLMLNHAGSPVTLWFHDSGLRPRQNA